jgi:TM2 domain-containing membrane protein YozV
VPFVPIRQKDVGIAYLLWFFLGALGAHQFYLGKIGRGIFYLLTVGGFLIGIVIDLFTLASQTRRVNAELASGVRR